MEIILKKITSTITIYILALVVIIIFIFPIIWLLLMSIKNPVDAFSIPPKLIFKPTFQYYYILWFEKGFSKYFINSMIISLCTILISILIASMGSFALTWYKKKISGIILIIVLVIRMFPKFALLIPFFYISQMFGLFDSRTLIVAIMVAINQPFAIWMMRGFFADVPHEFVDAARIDGCNIFEAFWRVVMPIMIPGLITAAIFTFLLAYNEFLVPLMLTSIKAKTLPVAIAEYGAEDIKYWSLSAAGAISIAAPAVILITFFQKYLVKGMMLGGIKE